MPIIDEYLQTLSQSDAEALERIRRIVATSAPEAQESISYGMPGFKYKGKYLITFGAFKGHLSIFPGAEAIETLGGQLAGFKLSKGTIQFTIEHQLPEQIIKDITELGVRRIAGAL